jgi:hypothetical protein
MNEPNKLGVLHYTGLVKLARDKHSGLLRKSVNYGRKKYSTGPWSALLVNFRLPYKNFPGTNALAYFCLSVYDEEKKF